MNGEEPGLERNKPPVSRRTVVVFSGYNPRAVVAFLRFFKEHDVEFWIVSRGPRDPIHDSSYASRVLFQRTGEELSLQLFDHVMDLLTSKRLKNTWHEVLILPTTEYLNRFLLKHRRPLEQAGFVVPLVGEELYCSLSDKYRFQDLCLQSDIPLPAEYPSWDSVEYPVVVKPKTYFSARRRVNPGPVILKTDEELKSFAITHDMHEFYLQQYIGGRSFYLLYYFMADGQYVVFSQENLMQQWGGRSIVGAISAGLHREEIAQRFATLLTSLRFRGLIMIEVKYEHGRFFAIEANPRVWGPSQLILDSGMSLMEWFAFENGLVDSAPTKEGYKEGIRYCWTGGIVADQRNGRSITFHGYPRERFVDEYTLWIQSDVYLRQDTIGMFIKEMGIGQE